MLQKLPVIILIGSNMLLNLMRILRNNNEEGDKGYVLEVNVLYSEKLYDFHNDLPLLFGKVKIE